MLMRDMHKERVYELILSLTHFHHSDSHAHFGSRLTPWLCLVRRCFAQQTQRGDEQNEQQTKKIRAQYLEMSHAWQKYIVVVVVVGTDK